METAIWDYLVGLANDPLVGGAVATVAILGLIDFVAGVANAVRQGVFQADFVGHWVQSQLAGRILPIILVIVFAPFAAPLTAVAGVAVAAYSVESIASIRRNLFLPGDDDAVDIVEGNGA